MQRKRTYSYQGIEYQATITYKRIKSLILKAKPETRELFLSCPHFVRLKDIDAFVERSLPRLLKRLEKRKEQSDDGRFYVLGEPSDLPLTTPEEKAAYLKKIGLPFLKERVRYYEGIMGIKKPYDVRVRTMKTRWGVNSEKTHRVTFSTALLTFSPDIIDAIVVHELAHHFQRNHSSKFYEVVYTYCPNYKILHTKLRKHIHA